jgi:integrase
MATIGNDSNGFKRILLQPLIAGLKRRPSEPVWPGGWRYRSAGMLQADLAEAKIPYADELRAVFDFHSLRGQFVTTLALAGVHPKMAQVLARHSDINLTMNVYTRVQEQTADAELIRLPAPPRPLSPPNGATP